MDFNCAALTFNKMYEFSTAEQRWISIMSLTYHFRKRYEEFRNNTNTMSSGKIQDLIDVYGFIECEKLFFNKNLVSGEFTSDGAIFQTYYDPSTMHVGNMLITQSEHLIVSHYLLNES